MVPYVLVAAWAVCAGVLAVYNWQDSQNESTLTRVAGTAWMAVLGGALIAGVGLAVVALAVVALDAVI